MKLSLMFSYMKVPVEIALYSIEKLEDTIGPVGKNIFESILTENCKK
jgi:hypothetical protein